MLQDFRCQVEWEGDRLGFTFGLQSSPMDFVRSSARCRTPGQGNTTDHSASPPAHRAHHRLDSSRSTSVVE